jgi:hypothetical protein
MRHNSGFPGYLSDTEMIQRFRSDSLDQAACQAISIVDVATCSADGYTYIRQYAFIMLYYTNIAYVPYILCVCRPDRRLCQDREINTLITQCAL